MLLLESIGCQPTLNEQAKRHSVQRGDWTETSEEMLAGLRGRLDSGDVVLAKGSLTSKTSGEGEIRKALVEARLMDCCQHQVRMSANHRVKKSPDHRLEMSGEIDGKHGWEWCVRQ